MLYTQAIELYVGKNARLRYSTIENWSKNLYNLNTKRALVDENGIIEWISGSFGSRVTNLYPMSILNGKKTKSEFTGVTFAATGQFLDTGCKVIHAAPYTTSSVSSKSISKMVVEHFIEVYLKYFLELIIVKQQLSVNR